MITVCKYVKNINTSGEKESLARCKWTSQRTKESIWVKYKKRENYNVHYEKWYYP